MRRFSINEIKNRSYLIIPLSCIIIYAFISLIKDNFNPVGASDFPAFYGAAKYIFTHPEFVYSERVDPQYPYTPALATILAPLALLPYEIAIWIFLIINVILAEIMIILFDEILRLKNVKNKIYRLLFLLVISNGLRYVQQFDLLTSKLITAFFLILFLKREIEYRELNKDRSKIKFKFIQYMYLIFAISITPQFIFLIFLYVFYNISLKDLLRIEQIKTYLIIILVFLIQNFMIFSIIYADPNSINTFLGGTWRGRHSPRPLTYSEIVENRMRLPVDSLTHVFQVLVYYYNIDVDLLIPSMVIMSIVTIIIHLRKNLPLEVKFGFFALFSLFFYTLIALRYYIVILPLIAILFINKIEEREEFNEFIKDNFILLIGLFCIVVLYFIPEIHYLLRLFPIFYNVPIQLLHIRSTIVYIILAITIFFLYRSNRERII
ncbi:MAG: hypothetical protein ACFFAH_00810 [Promethearchaeota archaeon]